MLGGGLLTPDHLRRQSFKRGQNGDLGKGQARMGTALLFLAQPSRAEARAAPGGCDTRKHHRAAGGALLMNYFEATIGQRLNN